MDLSTVLFFADGTPITLGRVLSGLVVLVVGILIASTIARGQDRETPGAFTPLMGLFFVVVAGVVLIFLAMHPEHMPTLR